MSIDSKYIYPSKDGYKVDIRKSGKRLTERFSSRIFGGLDQAFLAAKAWRDRHHQEAFGYSVNSTQRYGDKRKGAIDSFEGLSLPPRVSIGYHKGKPYYFVVSHPDGKLRFSIAKLGLLESHRQACSAASL